MPSSTPANLVNAEAVTKTWGIRTVLSGVSLGIGAGERIGVVGRNGDGKSTLLDLLVGDVQPDSGRVTRTRDLTVAHLAQADRDEDDTTVGEWVLGEGPTHVWASDPRARDVVAHLIGDLDRARTLRSLSGGERRRAGLARILLRDSDLIVLDEPTNHLDLTGIRWLAAHLTARRSALLVVTHDRWFLDAVCERTWEVADASVSSYDGGYAAYVLARAERDRVAAATEARRRNLVRKELAWLRRGPPARTSKPRFRIDAATQLIEAEPPARDPLALERMATRRLGKDVVDVEDASVRLGDRDVIDDVTLRLGPGSRIGLVGPNGAGKTTLIRLMTGDLMPTAGRVKLGRTVHPALLSQNLRDVPADDTTVVAYVTGRHATAGGELSATELLERFGFTHTRLATRLADLSGGERRRLQLLQVVLDEPNLLVLDEPTNDLDIDTLTVIEDFLDTWAGTLIVVSHDRYFLERVTDDLYALPGDGTVRHLPRGIDQYLELVDAAVAGGNRTDAAPGTDRSQRSDRSDLSDAQSRRAQRKNVARLESRVSRLEAEEHRVTEQMAEHATDHIRLTELDARLRELRSERDAAEAEWYAAAEALEA